MITPTPWTILVMCHFVCKAVNHILFSGDNFSVYSILDDEILDRILHFDYHFAIHKIKS